MKAFFAVLHFFWPWLERLSPEEVKSREDRNRNSESRVAALKFERDTEVALEEVRRLVDSEAERRRVADQKAAIYLPLVAALVPLILTVVSALSERQASAAPTWVNMLLLGLAVAYTSAAGIWAFRVLEVSASHEPGLRDFELSWKKPRPSQDFARRLLSHVLRNHDGINWKVSCIKMAHAFLLRAFLTFSLLLILNIGWYLAMKLLNSI